MITKIAFKDFPHLFQVDSGDFPDDGNIDVRVVVGHDITHASHLPIRKLAQNVAGFSREMRCGFPNNFDSPNDGVLLFAILR